MFQSLPDRLRISCQPRGGETAKHIQLPIIEVCLRALGETEQKNREIRRPECDHHPIPAAPPLPFSGNALLDEAAAKIGVNQPTCRPFDGLGQASIVDVLGSGKTRKRLELIYGHPPSLVQ